MKRSVVCLVVGLLFAGVGRSEGYTVPTHEALVSLSLRLLYADMARALWVGDVEKATLFYKAASFWEQWEKELKQGVGDVDRYFWLFIPMSLPVHHGWNPLTDAGWFGAPGATDFADMYEGQALYAFFEGKNLTRMSWLVGAVLHMPQDLCVPHHAVCAVGDGHADHERAVESVVSHIGTQQPGIYTLPGFSEDELVYQPASVWVRHAASLSRPAYEVVGPRNDVARQSDEAVGTVMLYHASRLGAGYLLYLYRYLHHE